MNQAAITHHPIFFGIGGAMAPLGPSGYATLPPNITNCAAPS